MSGPRIKVIGPDLNLGELRRLTKDEPDEKRVMLAVEHFDEGPNAAGPLVGVDTTGRSVWLRGGE